MRRCVVVGFGVLLGLAVAWAGTDANTPPAAQAAATQPAGVSVKERREKLKAAINADQSDLTKARAALMDVGNVSLGFAKGPFERSPDSNTLPEGIGVQQWDGKFFLYYSDDFNRMTRGPAPEVWLESIVAARKGGYKLIGVELAVRPSDEVLKERNRLLTQADATIRKGLLELSKTFPQLQRTSLRTIQEQLEKKEPVVGRVSIWALRGHGKGGSKEVELPQDRYSILVVIRPLHFGNEGQLGMFILPEYGNLSLMGQVHYDAGDPKLDAAVKKLIGDALAPLKELNLRVNAALGTLG